MHEMKKLNSLRTTKHDHTFSREIDDAEVSTASTIRQTHTLYRNIFDVQLTVCMLDIWTVYF